MGHIDWLVNRDGVLFAPDALDVPENDGDEAESSKPRPGQTDRADESENDPDQIEVGDPRDGP
jgi:hypothetical protein